MTRTDAVIVICVATALAFLLGCRGGANIDTGPSTTTESTGSVTTEPTCVSPTRGDLDEYEEWGRRQGYLELIAACVGDHANTAWFLLSRSPRIIVVAVCNGDPGDRRCIVNRTVRD